MQIAQALYHDKSNLIAEILSTGRRSQRDGDPDIGKHMSNLGLALRLRAERTGDAGDLQKAISVEELALYLTDLEGHDSSAGGREHEQGG